MADPNWKKGFYYDSLPPHTGMKLARRTCSPFVNPLHTHRTHRRNRDHNISLWTRMGPAIRATSPDTAVI
jgi:homoserine acetyltransferase